MYAFRCYTAIPGPYLYDSRPGEFIPSRYGSWHQAAGFCRSFQTPTHRVPPRLLMKLERATLGRFSPNKILCNTIEVCLFNNPTISSIGRGHVSLQSELAQTQLKAIR